MVVYNVHSKIGFLQTLWREINSRDQKKMSVPCVWTILPFKGHKGRKRAQVVILVESWVDSLKIIPVYLFPKTRESTFSTYFERKHFFFHYSCITVYLLVYFSLFWWWFLEDESVGINSTLASHVMVYLFICHVFSRLSIIWWY